MAHVHCSWLLRKCNFILRKNSCQQYKWTIRRLRISEAKSPFYTLVTLCHEGYPFRTDFSYYNTSIYFYSSEIHYELIFVRYSLRNKVRLCEVDSEMFPFSFITLVVETKKCNFAPLKVYGIINSFLKTRI